MQIICHRWRKTGLGEDWGYVGQRSQCGQKIAHPYYMGNYYLHRKLLRTYDAHHTKYLTPHPREIIIHGGP
jgi:hypothetical protein